MVTRRAIIDQLKKISFRHDGWGRTEVSELHKIILPDEEIYECVNGFYDGGFALLVATNVRVLLIDKKPLNYLSVEDMRFDMISEIDYNNRIFGAGIVISSGGKNLHFSSFNQARLRKLIGHVQDCMAEVKKRQDNHQEGQIQHLEQINNQLEAFIEATQQYQAELENQSQAGNFVASARLEPPKPSHELADFLYAQSLLAQHRKQQDEVDERQPVAAVAAQPENPTEPTLVSVNDKQMQEMYESALQEVYRAQPEPLPSEDIIFQQNTHEINPIVVAYSKLPYLLRNRRFRELSANTPEVAST
ncbi:MAG TPA: PH domain-containing protein [Candidatus Sulfotelmatobacter sp.]|nr:PH domain-containing protein [Candidatus Sulfotelmatobacter sp.]